MCIHEEIKRNNTVREDEDLHKVDIVIVGTMGKGHYHRSTKNNTQEQMG